MDNSLIDNDRLKPCQSHISVDVYIAYLRAHSYTYALLVVALIIANQTVKVISDFWLAKWTDKDESDQTNKLDSLDQSVNTYIIAYIMLSLFSVIISLCTNLFAQLIAIKAVRLLHDNLLDTLVRCSLRFFDKTPIGRIMNRFTNDINVIDKVFQSYLIGILF